MYRFRLLILAIIVWLVLALNVERPDDLLGLGNINLSPAFYVVILALMVTVLVIPEFGRFPIDLELAAIVVGYFLFRLALGSKSLWAILSHYVTFIELIMMLVTFWIARSVSSSIIRFEHSIDETVIGTDDQDTPGLIADKQLIEDEIRRARRYDRTIALLYIEFGAMSALAGGLVARWNRKQLLEKHYLQVYITQLVKDLLLEPFDLTTWHQDRMIICLPEKSRTEAAELARKLEEVFQVLLEVKPGIGTASFPSDALLLSDLLTVARNNMRGTPTRSQLPTTLPVGMQLKEPRLEERRA